jgi:alpha-methylacyl-CoA racemase
MREQLAELFSTKTRPQWCEIMRGADACFAPVLDLDEAPNHPQNDARGTFAIIDGVVQPSPAPRFSRTPGAIRGSAPAPGAHNVKALSDWGVPEALVEELFPAGADSVR